MRWLLIVVVVLLATIGGVSFAVWHWAEGQMEAGYATWAASVAAEGWTVRNGPGRRSGWPLAAELMLPDFAVTDAAGIGGLTATNVTLHVDLFSPYLLTVLFGGTETARLGPGLSVPFSADRLALLVPLAPDRLPDSASLDAKAIRFAAPLDGLTVALLQGQFAWHPAAGKGDEAVSFRVSSEAIALPPPPAPQAPLGSHIASATIEGAVTGPLGDAADPEARAAAWRDGGGRVLLRRIALGWGPLGVSGNATLMLDDGLQPAGSAALRLVGYDDAMTALVAGHVLSAQAAKAAKAVLGLLALASSGGQPGVEVPLNLQGGTLAMGQIPLARMQKLVWSGTAGAVSVSP